MDGGPAFRAQLNCKFSIHADPVWIEKSPASRRRHSNSLDNNSVAVHRHLEIFPLGCARPNPVFHMGLDRHSPAALHYIFQLKTYPKTISRFSARGLLT